jgi:hypothetical protein
MLTMKFAPHRARRGSRDPARRITHADRAVTLVGTGLHNGLRVSFTMVAVNYGDVAPGVFQITLTDGYSFVGSVVSGGTDIL